ncbi:MAG: hypothetical protein RML93_13445 [Anaerolineales bacterium]|nr:hypothetical protein [Anaerolineales bacterium]MCS7248130.1 hypothetical protein [Anaerolineales bacterium]MDW8161942.1 hypothetical protein [Anaerolineales bacterium]MDW8448278.1 hypothetical protein [Anaerolineales bacterium]
MLDPSALILVAILKSPRDLEIARVLGWYRIPMRSAPKVIPVDYLALYQTAAFGKAKWRIEYIAEIRGVELTTRGELLQNELDHPYANQEYYKVQLGPLVSLENPLPVGRWKRITFFYTLGEYFLRAKSVDDLILAEGDRAGVWRALRERNTQAYPSGKPEESETELSPTLLAALLGIAGAWKVYSKSSERGV